MPPHDHRLTLLGKPGCHRCDDVRAVVARLADELGVAWDERDVRADPADFEEYADRIPVLLLDGREHGFWTVDEARLRRDLAR